MTASQHNNELSSIMNDGRKKLNLDDTNYAGMYGNTENFSTRGGSVNRAVQDKLGLADMDVYNWLLG